MNTKHTPGPWVVHEKPQSQYSYGATIGDGPTSVIATAAPSDARRIVECVNACEGIADPSAVPDMLWALREIMRECDENHSVLAKARAYSIARTAIAKATGR